MKSAISSSKCNTKRTKAPTPGPRGGCLLEALFVEQVGDGMPINQLIDLTQKGISHFVASINNCDICKGGGFGLFNLAHRDN